MAAAGGFGPELARRGGRARLLAPDRRLRAGRGRARCSRAIRPRSRPASPTARDEPARAWSPRFDDPAQPYLSQPHPGARAALLATTRSSRAWPSGRRRGTRRNERRAPAPRANAASSAQRVRPGGLGLRRRLGRVGQDQAADRPAAAADAGRGRPGAHPVPDLHQGGRGGDGAAAAAPPGRLGRRSTTRRSTRSCAALDAAAGRRRAARARALFARVLDLPGGMRIGTIHAFCQSLLRRFPLEAALSPHFRLVEDADADDGDARRARGRAGRRGARRRSRRSGVLAGLITAERVRPAGGGAARRPGRGWPRRSRSAARTGRAQRRALGIAAGGRGRGARARRSPGRRGSDAARRRAAASPRAARRRCRERAARMLDWLGAGAGAAGRSTGRTGAASS